MNRVLSAARVQLITWPATVTWPWIILFSSLVVNALLFSVIDVPQDDAVTGGLASVYAMTFIASMAVIAQEFRFSVGIGLTRRTFYAALSLLVGAQSLVFATILYLLLRVERATEGWGSGLRFFGIPFLTHANPLVQILVYAIPFMALSALGTCLALLYRRWGTTGMFALTLVAILVFGGLTVLISWQQWWTGIGHWFADRSPIELFVGGPALLTAVLAGCGYLMIQRTDP